MEIGRNHVGVVGAAGLRATRLHRAVDDRAVDALDLELAPECALAAWAGTDRVAALPARVTALRSEGGVTRKPRRRLGSMVLENEPT